MGGQRRGKGREGKDHPDDRDRENKLGGRGGCVRIPAHHGERRGDYRGGCNRWAGCGDGGRTGKTSKRISSSRRDAERGRSGKGSGPGFGGNDPKERSGTFDPCG